MNEKTDVFRSGSRMNNRIDRCTTQREEQVVRCQIGSNLHWMFDTNRIDDDDDDDDDGNNWVDSEE